MQRWPGAESRVEMLVWMDVFIIDTRSTGALRGLSGMASLVYTHGSAWEGGSDDDYCTMRLLFFSSFVFL